MWINNQDIFTMCGQMNANIGNNEWSQLTVSTG